MDATDEDAVDAGATRVIRVVIERIRGVPPRIAPRTAWHIGAC